MGIHVHTPAYRAKKAAYSRAYYQRNRAVIQKKYKEEYSPEESRLEYSRPEIRANHFLNSARCRAKKKNLEMTLTKEWILEKLANGRCEVTGILFNISPLQLGSGFHHPHSPSIDRKDQTKGYTPENCQMVVWIYNSAKGTHSHEDVMFLAETLCKTQMKTP